MTAIDERPTATDTERAQLLADARELLDFLEANPSLPFTRLEINEYPRGTDEEEREQVDEVATILDVEPDTTVGSHYAARRAFGGTSYSAVAIPDATMRRHQRIYRLGAAAVDGAGTEATR